MLSTTAFVLPRVGIHRIVGYHIAHRTGVGLTDFDVLFLLVCVPVGIGAFRPRRTIGIDELTVHDIQLAKAVEVMKEQLH